VGIWDKVTASIAEPVMQTMVVDQITRYAGPNGDGLRIAICLNRDIYQMWVDNWEKEGLESPDEARKWTQRAPTAWRLLTPVNVKRWLDEQHCQHLVEIIERTTGGEAWLEWTCKRFRDGLWRC
jgi:hypothetical protein